MVAHYYLDRFSLLGHFVILEGWANDFDLELSYDGQHIALSVQPIPRPDLVSTFGEEAKYWGFAACGALPTNIIDRNLFKLRYNREIERVAPQDQFSASEDLKFSSMVAAFQREVDSRGGSLLEIGSRMRSGAVYRSWFQNLKDYVGFDVMEGPNVDIVGDAHHLTRHVNRKFDFIFSIAVFEHLLMPWKVALEMNSILNQGGAALIIAPHAWPIHEEPWDFFRFSKESWSGIFNQHTGFEVVDARYQHPASIVPFYAHNEHFQSMSLGPAYVMSGCYVRKNAPAKVQWDAEVSEVYDVNYTHK